MHAPGIGNGPGARNRPTVGVQPSSRAAIARRRIAASFGAALLSLGAWADPAGAVTRTATPASLASVLQAARDGDVIVLSKGVYKSVRIAGRTFRKPLVLDARAATIEGFLARDVAGLEIRGGNFRLSPSTVNPKNGKTNAGIGLRFAQARNIKIGDISVIGPGAPPGAKVGPFGDGLGIQINRGEGIEIARSQFVGLRTGIGVARISDFRFLNNRFAALRADGINAGEVRKGLIEGNECRDTRVSGPEHADCIQLYSRPSSPPTADVVIRKNRARGHMQGIGIFNHVNKGVNDGGYDRILIEDNDIEVLFPNGIALMDSRDSIIRNNRVRTADGAKHRTDIRFRGEPKRCGNTVAAGAGRPGVVDPPC